MQKLTLFLSTLFLSFSLTAQQVIKLPFEEIPNVTYEKAEMQYHSKGWDTEVVTNVSEPSLLVYEPPKEKKNGTSVIIAPGGGLYALSMNSEGIDVAKWLNEKGITAFVLKYRLVPTGEDGSSQFGREYFLDPSGTLDKVGEVLPYSVNDGLEAVKYVRGHAEQYGLDPAKIGFMGFSAGGAVTMGVSYGYDKASRPDFLVPVYAWTTAMPVRTAPKDAPPMMLVCATNDGLGLAAGSIDIYNAWFKAGHNVELHMYSKGDHGFGLRQKGLPSDTWIERCYEWMRVENLTK
ncbi:alpha/beta hydrolase [Jiulongibacter sp. NS-SX5]|uniref:alpha/beta hydrolase n=1 Tax=Jiulongibacter sp. NS-SX5 TaxID=3463854 RepID=UPI0040583F64